VWLSLSLAFGDVVASSNIMIAATLVAYHQPALLHRLAFHMR
jgi:hypothetical protein